jgi:cell division septation protein DedD
LVAGAAAAKPEPKPASPPAAAPIPPAPKPAASGTGFAVQVGAFGNAAEATRLRDRLRAAGFTTFTETVNSDKGQLTRVRVGPVLSRAEADRLRAQLSAKAGVSGIVRPHP